MYDEQTVQAGDDANALTKELREMIEAGKPWEVIDKLSKLPCDRTQPALDTDDGAFCFGFALAVCGLYRSHLPRFLAMRTKSHGEDDVSLKLKVLLESRLWSASKQRRSAHHEAAIQAVNGLLKRSPDIVFNDLPFFLEVASFVRVDQLALWSDRIRNSSLRRVAQAGGSENPIAISEAVAEEYQRSMSPGLLAWFGLVLTREKKFEAALLPLEKALAIAPGHADALAIQAHALRELARLDSALESPEARVASTSNEQFALFCSNLYGLQKNMLASLRFFRAYTTRLRSLENLAKRILCCYERI